MRELKPSKSLPHVPRRHQCEQAQILRSYCRALLEVLHTLSNNPTRGTLKSTKGLRQRLDKLSKYIVISIAGEELVYRASSTVAIP